MTKSLKTLLLAQILANFGDIFLRLVVIANIYQLTASVTASSLVPILIGGTGFMASFLVPLLTQKLALNRLFFQAQLFKSLLLIGLVGSLLLAIRSKLWLVYLLISMISLVDGLMAPVAYALVPIYADDLVKANSALSFASEGINLVGWGLGGLIFSLLGLRQSLFMIVLLFSLSTLVSFFLPSISPSPRQAEAQESKNSKILTKGWRLVFNSPLLKLMVKLNLLEIIANSLWVSSIILVFITSVLNQGESYWGYANASYSVGIMLAAYLIYDTYDRLPLKKWQSMVLAVGVMTVATLSLIIFPNPFYFLLASLLIGFFSQFKEVPQAILVQEAVSETYLADIYAVYEVISALAFSLIVFLMSYLVDNFGIHIVFALVILCLVIENLLILRYRQLLE